MVQDYRLVDLASQVKDELNALSEQAKAVESKPSGIRWANTIPVELRIGRAVALIGELSMEIEASLDPLIDEWLIEGGSVTKLSRLTGISRPTLTRRKNRIIRKNNDGQRDANSK